MVQGMLLSNMLDHLNIPLDRYFQKTSYRERERHILNCKQCACVRECVHMLLGEAIGPDTFCPNCGELEKLAYS